MTPVLSRAQMRAFDTAAVERSRVPSLLLMENAGRGAADVLVRLWPGALAGGAVTVVCGTGNNGGDGFVVARHLLVRGSRPTVFLAGDSQKMTPDARANFEAWRGIGGTTHELLPGAGTMPLSRAAAESAVVVDALFGTGLDRPIAGSMAAVIEAINATTAARFALDLPSGLDADTGVSLGVAVQAQATATFAHAKRGLLTPNGARLAGKVHVVDIGVPPAVSGEVADCATLLEVADVTGWTPRRPAGAHKGSAGHLLVLAASRGKVGAAKLVARGALRTGAGVVTIATWPETSVVLEAEAVETMTARIDPLSIQQSLAALLDGKRAVVVGPGFGVGDESRAVVEHLWSSWRGPLVVDADALTILAGSELPLASSHAILTPHPGEAGRLLDKPPATVEQDRYGCARALVAATGAVAVLKGAHTIIASPDGRLAVSPIACPSLATPGSGDVLAGVIGAMSCSLPAFEAACAGVMLHGLAAEAWSRDHGGADRGLLASEIADAVRV